MAFANRDLTDIHQFTRDELTFILDQSARIKRALGDKDVAGYRLAGDRDLLAALLFYENSTRTRTSFEIAALRLGMRVTGFAGTEGTSVKKGESLRHTLDMYEAYQCDALIMRHRWTAPPGSRPSTWRSRSSTPGTASTSTRPRRCSTCSPSASVTAVWTTSTSAWPGTSSTAAPCTP
jgi:hypothetical protein